MFNNNPNKANNIYDYFTVNNSHRLQITVMIQVRGKNKPVLES